MLLWRITLKDCQNEVYCQQGALFSFHTKYIQRHQQFLLLFYSMQSNNVWNLVEHVTNIQYKLLSQQLGPRAV